MSIANLLSSRLRQLLLTQLLRLLARLLPLLVAAIQRKTGSQGLRPRPADPSGAAAAPAGGRVFDGEYRREESIAQAGARWPLH